MKKIPFITLDKAKEIIAEIPTPFHLYDEAGIRRNARALKAAFAWNKGFKEFFAVKATPNPYILKILHEEGCGCDCATYTELLLAEAVGITGQDVMFSSNVTPEKDMRKAEEMGAYINLDDATYVDFLERFTFAKGSGRSRWIPAKEEGSAATLVPIWSWSRAASIRTSAMRFPCAK